MIITAAFALAALAAVLALVPLTRNEQRDTTIRLALGFVLICGGVALFVIGARP